MTPTDRAVAAAYSATGAGWRDGPHAVYRHLADALVRRSPVALAGSRVLDVGAGTGAAGEAARAAGAGCVVAVDVAPGMLRAGDGTRDAAVVGDALSLPFAAGAFDVAVAAFSFNHLGDPAAGFVEARRVVRGGGAVLASAYADDDHHPVKAEVERALAGRGWVQAPWELEVKRERAPRLASEAACRAVLDAAGIAGTVERVRVVLDGVDPAAMVAWRLGMAQHAPFVAALGPLARRSVVDEVLGRLGPACPPLVRSVVVVTVPC